MADTPERPPSRRPHRRFVYCILFLMILINVAVRYPIDHAVPNGSDTFFVLKLSYSLAQSGHANWILTPMSYFGLYPLSYPSGLPFAVAELQITGGTAWNALPLLFCMFFTLLLILGGFIFFRLLGLRDDLSALFCGLMTFTPVFVFFTYEQISGRGFLVPLFVLALYMVMWTGGSIRIRLLLFAALTIGAFAIHRASFMVLLLASLATLIQFMAGFVRRVNSKVKLAAYVSCIVFGITMVVWPFTPGLQEFFSGIPEMSSSYMMAEWEFRTGFLFEGTSLPILLANLATNYVGGMGLAILVFPLGFILLYPKSRCSREGDTFLILALLLFAPLLWKAQYIQLMMLPFVYLIVGLAIQRRDRFRDMIPTRLRVVSRVRRRSSTPSTRSRHSGFVLVGTFLVACMLFSVALFAHRASIVEPSTGNRNWPTDSVANLGLYVGSFSDERHGAFVSASGLLDRRIAWFSEWDSPVSDSVSLQATGYLNATRDDFLISSDSGGYWYFLISFYDFKRFYILDPSIPNRSLFDLSYGDIYGFFRLYFEDPNNAYTPPRVSTSQAGIRTVVEINAMGNTAHNIYFGEGTLSSPFLREISSMTYLLYRNDDYTAFLAAQPA